MQGSRGRVKVRTNGHLEEHATIRSSDFVKATGSIEANGVFPVLVRGKDHAADAAGAGVTQESLEDGTTHTPASVRAVDGHPDDLGQFTSLRHETASANEATSGLGDEEIRVRVVCRDVIQVMVEAIIRHSKVLNESFKD